MDKIFAYSHKIKICVGMGDPALRAGDFGVARIAHGDMYYAAVKSACGR